MKLMFSILALLLGGAAVTLAQGIQPRVIDISGKGVPDVEVRSLASCQQTVGGQATATTSTKTDAEGQFNWPLALPGIGSSCGLTVTYNFSLHKDGYVFSRNEFTYRPGNTITPIPIAPFDNRVNLILASTSLNLPPIWESVSAASYRNNQLMAAEMITAGFGFGLAASTELATLPLPISLAWRRVLIKDFAGTERAAKLLFVSPAQINYIAPEGLADGTAIIRLVDESGNLIAAGVAEIGKVSPGIFTANADGQGVPAAVIVRVKPGNAQSYEPVARFDEQQRRFVPLALDLGSDDELIVLALFGTGWRQASNPANVLVSVGNDTTNYIQCPVEYVGTQPTIEGLDQLNVRLPRAVIGKGDVNVVVSINGIFTNLVQLKIK